MSMEPGMHHRMGVILLQYQQKSVVASTPQCCCINTGVLPRQHSSTFTRLWPLTMKAECTRSTSERRMAMVMTMSPLSL